MAFELYALLHPISHEVRYIGKSINSKSRYHHHINDALTQKKDYPVSRWIRKLNRSGLRPTMTVFEIFETMEDLNDAEIKHIEILKESGVKLLNVSKGGDGGFTSDMIKKANETLGEKGRKERVRKSRATMGPERMREKAQKAMITIGSEGLVIRSRKAMNTLGEEGLSARNKKTAETLGVEGRRARALKMAQTKNRTKIFPVGVNFNTKRNKWTAYTSKSEYGFEKYIGIFPTSEEAIAALNDYRVLNPPKV